MKRILTLMSELATILLAGETEAGNAEVQPARDSRFKAMNCRWGGRLIPAIPFCQTQSQFSVLECLKKPNKKSPPKAVSLFAQGKKSLKTKKWICPIHAEPIQ